MNQMIELLLKHSYWVLFASVIGRQACLPVPANLLLLGAGALAGFGRLNLGGILVCSVAAFVLADLAWFEAGRKWGTRTLHFFCRVSKDPHSCAEEMVNKFRRRGPKSLLISKFVIGLDAIASPLSGICGMGRNQFLFFDGLGALAWSSAYIAAGYIFRSQLDRIAADSEKVGGILGIAVIVGLGCLIAVRLSHWYRFLREFRLAQITPEELKEKLKSGVPILLLDLQGDERRPSGPVAIPGSIRMDPHQLEWYVKQYRGIDLSIDREVILYGASSKDFASARVALALRRRGFEKVRPLGGGLAAWRDRGFPVTTNPPLLPTAEHAVFALREVLQHSRIKVARLLNRNTAEVDQLLERAKARIQSSHESDHPLLSKDVMKGPKRETQDLLATHPRGNANAPD